MQISEHCEDSLGHEGRIGFSATPHSIIHSITLKMTRSSDRVSLCAVNEWIYLSGIGVVIITLSLTLSPFVRQLRGWISLSLQTLTPAIQAQCSMGGHLCVCVWSVCVCVCVWTASGALPEADQPGPDEDNAQQREVLHAGLQRGRRCFWPLASWLRVGLDQWLTGSWIVYYLSHTSVLCCNDAANGAVFCTCRCLCCKEGFSSIVVCRH